MTARLTALFHTPRAALLAGLAVFAAVTTYPATRTLAQADAVVAKVDGQEIRQGDLDAAEQDIGQSLPPMPIEQKREYLITYVTDMVLVSRAAEAHKIADTAEFKRKLAMARSKLLSETLLTDEAKAATTDAAMRKVYEDATKQLMPEPEVRARHILVETEDEAKKIAADLKKGGDFAAIAKDKSKDPGSKDNGGDLDYFAKDQMVPEFAEVAFKLEKGQTSEPVKTQFGWHIIRVEDKRTKPVPSFEQVKDQIENYVQRKAQAELITKLRAEAKIERMDAKPADKPELKK